ncbi:uncharacterized protein FOMMEDRAFT_135544 [Fomitiporia mediterranea MF3/22]|uniref:uncharacterized protein n=1 Tax=Fomitiporia mediterranea (strain MF3/22) TaxID=694068 RepID=UPI00044091C2|nr:uncharacterized protein FOMMEDRAFT_135544 [Fomitiporia mediterranea MF3/22]EJD01307.1 hypothetical protein FOMMEDRAFT_135544 [Fomitiporia mediterranea MF3/22]
MDDAQEDPGTVAGVPKETTTKVKRTYGRKKESTDASGESSFAQTSSRTRFESLDEGGITEGARFSKFLQNDASDAFGWREKLALIDKQFDEKESEATSKLTDELTDDRTNRDNSSAKSVSTEDDSVGLHDESLLSGSIHPPSSQSDPPSSGSIEADNAKLKSSSTNATTTELEKTTEEFPAMTVSDEHQKAQNALSVFQDDDDSSDALDEPALRRKQPKAAAKKPKEKANKIKKLSKKEENESKKAHARIMADQRVSITKRAEQYTVEHLLRSVRQKQDKSEVKPSCVSSDPIQDFTSSPKLNSRGTSTEREPKAGPSNLRETSDSDMPDTHGSLDARLGETLKGEDTQRKKNLIAAKRLALESSKAHAISDESDSDDLEVVETGHDGIAKQLMVSSTYEKKLAGVAGFRAGSSRHSLSKQLEGSQGDRMLTLAAKSTFADRDSRRHNNALGHRDLQAAILNKAAKQSMQMTKEKEEEWKRRGGKLSGKLRAAAAAANQSLSLDRLVDEITSRQRNSAENDQAEVVDGGSSDAEYDSDGEWMPDDRGSASPVRHQTMDDSGEDELGGSGRDLGDSDVEGEKILVKLEQQIDTDEDETSRPPRPSRRSAGMLVVTDSDGEETRTLPSKGRVLVPDTSVIIGDRGRASVVSSEGGPEEWNKENEITMPVDSGDDKENVMVISPTARNRTQVPRSRSPRGINRTNEGAQRVSSPPGVDAEHGASRSARVPLQARRMSSFDDPFLSRSPSLGTSFGTPKSNGALSAVASPVSLRPAFDGNSGGFTQFFNDEEGFTPSNMDSHTKGVLQPAFRLQVGNDAEDSPFNFSPDPKSVKLNAPFTRREDSDFLNRSKHLTNDDELSLTLDTSRLQPALDVATQVRRKADAVFEKEQEFVIEEAGKNTASSRGKQELYISENGLLTQTRPDGSTPIVYRSGVLPQTSDLVGSKIPTPPTTTQRLPLSTLSLATESVSPSKRLTRLAKGKARASLSDDENDLPANAFTRLLAGAKQQQNREKKRLGKSLFVEGEAQESDEDEMFGFGAPKAKDDEEESENEDPDAVVENLVDDATMDAEQLAEERVLEKVKDQLEEEDAALEKYHQAAIEGKYRGKRRGGGIAMDDSESDEDEDEEARRLRRRMHKKRRIQGDKLEDLGKDEKSRAFYDAYQRDILEDDSEDFAHLASDDMDVEDENGEEEEPETVTTSEIQAQLREVARQQKGKAKETRFFDAADVEWAVSQRSSDDEFDVREIEDQPKKAPRKRPVFGQADVPDLDDSLLRMPKKISDEQAAQLAAWRKEQSGRNLGTGGMRGAVTGTSHGSRSAGRKGTSMSKKVAGDSQEDQGRRKVKKTASVLASVSDRRSGFGL